MKHPTTAQSSSPDLQTLLEEAPPSRLRRQMVVGGTGLVSLASALCWPHAAWSATKGGTKPEALPFEPVAKQLTDNVVLPPGSRYQVIHATGDALN
ncbi:MAG: hypothetical protein ACO3TO_05535, partial [Burkholderiaceae bacterium]